MRWHFLPQSLSQQEPSSGATATQVHTCGHVRKKRASRLTIDAYTIPEGFTAQRPEVGIAELVNRANG